MNLRFLLVPAAAIAALPAAAQTSSPVDYVASAGAADLFERQSSQLVLQTTRDPKVRSFAQMMISDHGKSTAEVKAAAAKDGVTAPPPKLMPDQEQQIAALRSASGAARDAAYIRQQKVAHDQALAIHSGYSRSGTSPALQVSCPLLSGPSTVLVWTMKEKQNAIEEAQAGGDHRQTA